MSVQALDHQRVQLLEHGPIQVLVTLVAGPDVPRKLLQAKDSVSSIHQVHSKQQLPANSNHVSSPSSKLQAALEDVGWLLRILDNQEGLLLRLILGIVVAVAVRRVLRFASCLTQADTKCMPTRQQEDSSPLYEQTPKGQQHQEQQHHDLQPEQDQQQQHHHHHHHHHQQQQQGGGVHAAIPVVRYREVTKNRQLGEGGYAIVWAACWNKQRLILKQPKAGCREQLMKEAEMLEHSRHSHVVQLLGICHDTPALLMQWCRGGSLDYPRAAFTQTADAATMLKVLRDVASSVCCFHSEAGRSPQRALVHLDLRAANVLLGNEYGPHWDVKVADFGLAEWLGSGGSVVVPDVTNRRWVAPELLETIITNLQDSSSPVRPIIVSRASDVYMFGMFMLELLTGQMPFEEQLQRLQHWERLPLLAYRSPYHELGRLELPRQLKYQLPDSVWQQLKQLFDRCTTPKPADRPSMDEVHGALEQYLDQYGHQQQPQQQQQQQQPLLEPYTVTGGNIGAAATGVVAASCASVSGFALQQPALYAGPLGLTGSNSPLGLRATQLGQAAAT